jgi:hypothetical protein
MMVRLADEFGFRIGTFQHVLEGYKVADELARHGAGASTFSDWWAFKIEAWDAIPYNAALMTERGVVARSTRLVRTRPPPEPRSRQSRSLGRPDARRGHQTRHHQPGQTTRH